MIYENKVVVLPIGMKINNHFNHRIDTCKMKIVPRRKTLKIGNAIRINNLKEDTTFYNCIIFTEGTMTGNGIVPYEKHKCVIYFKKEEGKTLEVGSWRGQHDGHY